MRCQSRIGTSCQLSGEPPVDGEQQLESVGAPVGEGRIGDRHREVFAEPYLEARLAEKVGSGVFVIEGCGHSLHLVARDVDLPVWRPADRGSHGGLTPVVTAHRSTPPLADLGRESDATREPRSCRVHPDPQRGRGALVGALPGGEEQMVLVASETPRERTAGRGAGARPNCGRSRSGRRRADPQRPRPARGPASSGRPRVRPCEPSTGQRPRPGSSASSATAVGSNPVKLTVRPLSRRGGLRACRAPCSSPWRRGSRRGCRRGSSPSGCARRPR